MVLAVRRCLFWACALAGCGDNAPPPAPTLTEVVALPSVTTDKLDLLFVIDNEVSTNDHQVSLQLAFPALLAQLSIDGRPDLHVGAITPDLGTSTMSGAIGPDIVGSIGGCYGLGDDGQLKQFDPAIQARFLVDSVAEVNHPKTLAEDLSSILDVGSTGCGFQQHLSAVRAALANPSNAGFRRDDAALGVIVLSDEDDCSVLDPAIFGPASPALGALSHFRCTQFGVTCDEPDMTSYGPRTNCRPNASSTEIEDPGDFVDAFHGYVADPRRLAFGAIVAPNDIAIEPRAPAGGTTAMPALTHSCEWIDTNNTPEDADAGLRLAWIAGQFGDRGAIGSICNEDISPAATVMGINLRRAMGDPCIEDDVPTTHCTAVDELAGAETPLPACTATTPDCWELVADPTTCPNAAHQKLVVHRSTPAAEGTYTLLRC